MSVDPAEFDAVKAKVEDHDTVLDDHGTVIAELTSHLDEINVSFKTAVRNIEQLASTVVSLTSWLKAKPTKVLLVLVIGVFLGPDGVAHVKEIFGL